MKTVKVKTAIIGLSLLLGSMWAKAQQHEVSVNVGGGLSTLNYTVETGKQKSGMGATFGAGYRFIIDERWSIRSGVDFAIYAANFTADRDFSVTRNNVTDYENATFRLETVFPQGYQEKQRLTILQIPVMGQFMEPIDAYNKQKLYGAAGFKIGIPFGGMYKADGTTVRNTATYEEEYPYTTQTFMGFGAFSPAESKDKLAAFKPAFIFALEVGVRWALPNDMALYTGLFFDYGLNNIQKDAKNQFVEYERTANGGGVSVNPVVKSQLTDKISPMAFGIKVGIAMGL